MRRRLFKPGRATLLTANILMLVVMPAAAALAQEKAAATAGATAARYNSPPAQEESKFPEIEAVASSDFRSFSYIQPLLWQLHFEGHYFGVEETDVGSVGASWAFRLGKHVKLTPGLAVYFGERQTTAPALTIRWEIENRGFISQGLFIQSLRESEESGHPSIWDGNHLSARWWRLEIGPSWERLHTREENEWKGGGRFAFRMFRHVSAVLFVLAPETEVRGGILIHPARREP